MKSLRARPGVTGTGLQVKLGGPGYARSIWTRLITISANVRETINPLYIYIYIYERPRCTPAVTFSRMFHVSDLTDSTPSASVRLFGKRFRVRYYPRGRNVLHVFMRLDSDAREECTFAQTWDNWISLSDTFHLYARLIANGSIKREHFRAAEQWIHLYYAQCNRSHFCSD